VLLVVIALALSLALGSTGPTPTPGPNAAPAPAPIAPAASLLPPTLPGLGRDEGTFLVTSADDGSRVVYFVAGNARHSIIPADMQVELQRNPLWPVRSVSREDVLALPEGAPVGSARAGLLSAPTTAAESASAEALDAPAPEPVAVDAPAPAPVTPEATAPAPVIAQPAAPEPLTAEVAAPEPMTPEARASEPIVYVLRPGDNLTRISAQYGTTIEAILAANGLTNANKIYFGQPLVIPTGSGPDIVETPAEPAPVADETPAPRADIPSDGAEANTEPAAAAYTVKRGDSAIGIARRFGVDLDDLLALNGVADPNRVYVGQVLTIPS
jgi:LysM repeat protein